MDPEEPTTATEKPHESPQDVPKGDDQDHHSDPEYDKGDNSQNGNQGSKRKEPANDPDLKARRVFVGNLSFKTHWQRVREHMRRAGNVIRVDIFSNKDGRSKGCGLVEYSTLAEAERAMNELNQTTLDDRQIFVRKDDVDMAKHDHEHYEKQTRPPASRDRNHSYGGQRSRYDRRDYYYRSKSRSRSPRRGDRRRYERSYSRDRSYSPRRSRSRSSQRYRDRRSRSRSYGRDDRYRSRGDDRNRGHSRSRSWRRSRSRSVERDNRDRDRDRDYRNMGRPQGSDRSDKEQRRGCQIIVKNIPWSVTWQQLKDAFKEYGPIIRAEVPQDNTGRSKGYGFVRFEREKDAHTAIDNMDRASFNGREITVKVCDN